MENDSKELAAYCQQLWKNFSPLLNKVVEYEPTPITDAIKMLCGEVDDAVVPSEYVHIASRKERMYFIPKKVSEYLPETELVGGGWGWSSPGYPLRFVFAIKTIKNKKDESQTLSLAVYVGPARSGRDELIRALGEAGLKPAGKFREQTAKYQKIWDTAAIPLTEGGGAEQIKAEMEVLLGKAAEADVIGKIIRAAQTLKQPL